MAPAWFNINGRFLESGGNFALLIPKLAPNILYRKKNHNIKMVIFEKYSYAQILLNATSVSNVYKSHDLDRC